MGDERTKKQGLLSITWEEMSSEREKASALSSGPAGGLQAARTVLGKATERHCVLTADFFAYYRPDEAACASRRLRRRLEFQSDVKVSFDEGPYQPLRIYKRVLEY